MGRSAILINEELLLDYGIKPTDPPAYPLNGLRPKSLIISHLDHCGLTPNLMDMEPEIYCTGMTAKLSALLARDTLKIAENKRQIIPYYFEEIQEFERKVKAVEYREEFETHDYTACFYDAGHIPGSCAVHVEKEKNLFYTGDINIAQTELQNGADIAYPESDILIIESTYFGKNHLPRKIVEENFIESVRQTIDNGGIALIAAFSIGRTQEMMLILKKHRLNAYVDGMGVDVFNIFKKSRECVRDMDKLERAFAANIVNPEDREKILEEPCIIVTSAGMLNGGPVLYYINRIHNDARSKIHLTGFQAQDTNGKKALESRYIEDGRNIMKLNCGLEQFDFSAHAGDKELKEIVKKFADKGTGKVFPVHGENTAEFSKWIKEEMGVESTAPSNGDRF